jgi:glycosyltransferase involved in cell wall biosynthesis
VSRQLRDLHAERTGFAARKITVIHNGVDHTRFFPDAKTRILVRKELGLSDGQIGVGCVANLLPVKAHRTLLDALALISAEGHEDWRLILIGEGPERPSLEAFAAAHPGLSGRVSFLGPSNRVSELLQALDVFVLPSMAEGICNSLLEAMASGLPVIASAVGGNPEIGVDRQSGLLFPAGDAPALANLLRELLAQPGLRSQLGQGGLRRIRDEFSLQSMVQTYDKLYRSVRAAGVPVLSAG